MKGIREIKHRIKAVKNTAQITRAMQLVAASKMKRAQEHAISNRPYSLLFQEIFTQLSNQLDSLEHPLLSVRPVQKRGILVISTNRGLCGPLNSNLNRTLLDLPESTQFVCAGRKALQFLSRAKRSVIADFPLPDQVSFKSIRVIAEYMLELFIDGSIDTIEIAYPGFVNTLVQQPMLEKIAPIVDLEASLKALHKQYRMPEPTQNIENRSFTFEPDAKTILNELPSLFIKQTIYHCFLEAHAAEHSARMVAMKTATDNAKKIAQKLTLEYNKARQAAITQEILEIAASSLSK